MAELLGRVERLTTNTVAQPQINGQAQVKDDILSSIIYSV